MNQQFNSNENKGILWNLLSVNGAFNDIPETNAAKVKAEFEKIIATISSTISGNEQLVSLNKRVIGEMMRDIGKFAQALSPPIYNAAEISQQRQSRFNTDLKQKKTEYDKLNSTPIPAKIDFADKIDTPIGSEMDNMLAAQIALREKQLNLVLESQGQLQDKTAASKWLQNGQPSNNTHIKIGENIKLETNELFVAKKKVQFTEPIDDFMSLLKKVPLTSEAVSVTSEAVASTSEAVASTSEVESTDIREILAEILKKQIQILNFLAAKN